MDNLKAGTAGSWERDPRKPGPASVIQHPTAHEASDIERNGCPTCSETAVRHPPKRVSDLTRNTHTAGYLSLGLEGRLATLRRKTRLQAIRKEAPTARSRSNPVAALA